MELHVPFQLPVHSRIGCWILAFTGAVLAMASAALLVYSLVATSGYAGLIDHAIQVMLLGITFLGAVVAVVAYRGACTD